MIFADKLIDLRKRSEPLATIYWRAVTAGYLAWSFISDSWDKTWIVWPIAGVLFALVLAVERALRDRNR